MMNRRCMINYVAYTSKISSIQTIKEQAKRNGKDLRVFRSRVLRMLGNFYLKEMHGDELKKAWRKAFIEVQDDVKTEQQVSDFITSYCFKD